MRKKANASTLADVRERLKAGDDLSSLNYLELIDMDNLAVGVGEPLKLQIEDFLSAIREDRHPQVDALAGFAAVRTAERIIASSRQFGTTMV